VASKVILAFRSLDTGQPSFTPHSGPPSTALRSIELMESGPSHLRRFVQLLTHLRQARSGTARIWRGLEPRSAAYTPENQS
jgi:hypothetical protein